MQPIEELEKPTTPKASALVGTSPAIQRAQTLISQAAQNREPLLVRGEPGTGKELVVHTIHELGSPDPGPLVRVACRAVPEDRNLFGGPDQRPLSRLAEASGGTLFLDEIADLPLGQQKRLAALLSVPAGKIAPRTARIAATTARDLESLVEQGLFDRELHRCLTEIVIDLPPLAERQEDIPALVNHFVTQEPIRASITVEALSKLREYPWPGNVLELEETILEARVLARESGGAQVVIDVPHLRLGRHLKLAAANGTVDWTDLVPLNDGWRENIDKLEKALVRRSLSLSNGNKSKAAEALRIHRRLLYEKLRQFQMAK